MATSAEELTECVVCFETFKNPQLLPCQHTFCKPCVDQLVDAGSLRCPTCMTVSLTEDIKSDFRLAKFLDVLATRPEAMAGAERRGDTEASRKEKCGLCKGNAAAFWCNECGKWICRGCKMAHDGIGAASGVKHTIRSVAEKVQEAKTSLNVKLQEVEAATGALEKMSTKFSEAVNKIDTIKSESLVNCDKLRKRCHTAVDEQFDEIVLQITEKLNENSMVNEEKHIDVHEKLRALEQSKEQIIVMLTSEDRTKVIRDVVRTEDFAKQAVQAAQLSRDDHTIKIQHATINSNVQWNKLKFATVAWSTSVDKPPTIEPNRYISFGDQGKNRRDAGSRFQADIEARHYLQEFVDDDAIDDAYSGLTMPVGRGRGNGKQAHGASRAPSQPGSQAPVAESGSMSLRRRSGVRSPYVGSATPIDHADMPVSLEYQVDDDPCSICLEAPTNPVVLDKCKHVFCKVCIDESFRKMQPKCPNCGEVYGPLKGTQPDNGTMVFYRLTQSLPGYEGRECIEIHYSFPNGVQTEKHPNPGKMYRGTNRTAFLPDTKEGHEVLGLLRRAFDARLVFTVGRSVTTGADDCVVWNGIQHKTSIMGTYGYPDPTYLTRVKQELAAQGIN